MLTPNVIVWLLLTGVVILGIINFIFAIFNIINTYRLYKNKEFNNLRKCMKILKFGSIPYFVVNFLIYSLLFLLFFAASRGIIIFTPIPIIFIIPILFTYVTTVFTSCYGIGFVAMIKKEAKMGTGKLILHVLLQLCFILDVLDTIILLMKYKRIKQNIEAQDFT